MTETYRSSEYKIQVRGDDGKPGAATVRGEIIGPFGVADNIASEGNDDEGYYRVTHLHSGLKIAALCSKNREACISACKELAELVPDWKSHKPLRLAEKNGLTLEELRKTVNRVSRKHNCDGNRVPKSWTPD